MANLTEQEKWEKGIYQIEENDPVHGGEDGITNKPIKQLANRTSWLKNQLETTKQQGRPKPLSATTTEAVESDGHTHSLPQGSTTQKGLIQLTDSINMASSVFGASALAVKNAYDKAVEADNHAERAYHLAESKQSPATTLAGYGIGDFKVGTSTGDANDCKIDGNYYFASGQNLPSAGEWHIAVMSGGQPNAIRQIARKANESKVQTRYFNGASWSAWKDVGGDGVPVGSVVAFPSAVQNPHGFLRCDGSSFGQETYPALYQALGVNTLPDLRRSDVGMTAYFATDNIPEGWIAFDEIEALVSEQAYPELYRYLVAKYGSLSAVPKAKDRFIRNAGALLAVGEVQQDALQDHFHYIPTEAEGAIIKPKKISLSSFAIMIPPMGRQVHLSSHNKAGCRQTTRRSPVRQGQKPTLRLRRIGQRKIRELRKKLARNPLFSNSALKHKTPLMGCSFGLKPLAM
ncbi:tail fiber protein [Avibacterium paragallinarum]